MFPIIDFRNGRYQGETKNQLPHGVGIFMDKNFLFCLGEWIAGEVRGHALVVYPSGRIFCGDIVGRTASQLATYELAEDHVQLVTFARTRRHNEAEKLAAVLPLLGVVLEIDNTNPEQARVLREHGFAQNDPQANLATIARVLDLDKNGPKLLASHSNCIQYFQDYFLAAYPEVFEFLVSESRGRKEYFFGLRGEGLGIRIEPNEELGLQVKRTGRVYFIRGVGFFTRENQMRDLGLKTLDNAMKGIIYEEGVFSLPQTVVKYEAGRRPQNCFANFHNYIKRSLFYRDKVLPTDYVYELENFVYGFNENLRKVETEKLAQFTIENPNNTGHNLADIERKRREKEREKEQYVRSKDTAVETPNPYNPNTLKVTNPDYNLQRAKDEIYRSVSKKKGTHPAVDYNNVEYVDPNYRKVPRDNRVDPRPDDRRPYEPSPIRETYYEPKEKEPYYEPRRNDIVRGRVGSTTPILDSKKKSPYSYLDREVDPPVRPRLYEQFPPSSYTSGPARRPLEEPKRYNYTPQEYPDHSFASPTKLPASLYPKTDKSYLEDTGNSEPLSRAGRTRYNYHFDDDPDYVRPPTPSPRPKRRLTDHTYDYN